MCETCLESELEYKHWPGHACSKNVKGNFIACEFLVKGVDTFGVVLYRKPVNFIFHFDEVHFGFSIRYNNSLFGNYCLKSNIVKRNSISFSCFPEYI